MKKIAQAFLFVIIAWIIGTFWMVGTHIAQAATITVTTPTDEVTVNGTCSLREAIRAANTDITIDGCTAGSGGDIVVIPAGIYTLTLTDTVQASGYATHIQITSSLQLVGAGRDQTIISGCDAQICPGHKRLFWVTPLGQVIVRDLTLQHNNYTTLFGLQGAFGGGILNEGILSLDNVDMRELGAAYGGAIYNSGNLDIRSTQFISNFAGYVYGGQYFIGGGGAIYGAQGTIKINGGNLLANNAPDGGAINVVSGTLQLNQSTLIGNSGRAISSNGEFTMTYSMIQNSIGGGLISSGLLYMDYSKVENNVSQGTSLKYSEAPANCAGMLIQGAFTIRNSSIVSNTSQAGTPRSPNLTSDVGGICANANGTIENSAIYSNAASFVGGIRATGHVKLINTTISGNVGYSQTGGLEVQGTSELQYVTIASNTAPIASNVYVTGYTYYSAVVGGSVYVVVTGSLTFTHSIIAAPIGDVNCTIGQGGIHSAGHNLSSDQSCGSFTATGDITNTNPKLAPLQTDAWGGKPTHALLTGSPAINAGVTVSESIVTVDQRHIPRRWGGPNTDIGAYEMFDLIPKQLWLPILQR